MRMQCTEEERERARERERERARESERESARERARERESERARARRERGEPHTEKRETCFSIIAWKEGARYTTEKARTQQTKHEKTGEKKSLGGR